MRAFLDQSALVGLNPAMAELPEIIILADQMTDRLSGRELTSFRLGMDKPLNRPPADYDLLLGRPLDRVRPLGKWLVVDFSGPGPNLLVHPGMGMDLVESSVPLDKETQFEFHFSGRTGFKIRYWWFGYLRLAEPGRSRAEAGDIGPVPFTGECSRDYLVELARTKPRTGLKAFLTNQKNLAGIGNYYIHDICHCLKAHPLTKMGSLSPDQLDRLHGAVETTLSQAVERGINSYEFDFFGRTGQWSSEEFQVGYRAGQPCPVCGTEIIKIKAANAASYICPVCQPEPN